MRIALIATAAVAAGSIPSHASAQFVSGSDPAPGYSSILNSDYSAAEREIRQARTSPYDPARSINLGVVLAKTGRRAEAAEQFQRVLMEADVEFLLANGQAVRSHEVARRAMAALKDGALAN